MEKPFTAWGAAPQRLLLAGLCSCYSLWAAAQSVPVAPLTVGDERPYFATIGRQVEPDLVGKPERLADYLEWFQQRLINDARLIAFDATAVIDASGAVQLTGFTEYQETRRALRLFLETLRFERIDDRMVRVPDDTVESRPFGFVTASHSLCYADPDSQREVVTECLWGDPVFLLHKTDHGTYWCHTAEGYLGYLATGAIQPVDAAEFTHYQEGPQLTMRFDHALADGRTLPVGARLKVAHQGGDEMECILPTGETVAVPAACCRVDRGDNVERIHRVLTSARGLIKTPYLWGGKSSQGIDCSGLMQVAFASESFHLPRDANQQMVVGRMAATRWYRAGMRPGDALFFLGPLGKVRHTGLYLGDDQFLHAVMPVVTISSLNPEHDNYDAHRSRQFAFAKRLLDD